MSTDSASDLERLRGLRERVAEIERDESSYVIGDVDTTQSVLKTYRARIAGIEAAWPDSRLLDEYQRTSGGSDSVWVEDLIAEIRHRNLDF
ncbi:hypothetical protein NPJ82_09355 [Sphingomonas sp. NY01]|uniref:hypothetical protein n=1 Tax=Sphingomonas sp. NY01 TaxID=2968057 RepID=UPI00315C9B18